MNYRNVRHLLSLGALLSAVTALAPVAVAEEEVMEEVVVTGDLNSLPGEDVKSIFGFNKSILETPRSVSTVSEELMDRMNMQDIDELVTVSPGSFTQSFFGVAGGLDVRGTPGETYFRGIRRLDNPGNYPTPIGASDRVDIVRGPASPIYGPSKIGGYLNFNPKSARIEETGYSFAWVAPSTLCQRFGLTARTPRSQPTMTEKRLTFSQDVITQQNLRESRTVSLNFRIPLVLSNGLSATEDHLDRQASSESAFDNIGNAFGSARVE